MRVCWTPWKKCWSCRSTGTCFPRLINNRPAWGRTRMLRFMHCILSWSLVWISVRLQNGPILFSCRPLLWSCLVSFQSSSSIKGPMIPRTRTWLLEGLLHCWSTFLLLSRLWARGFIASAGRMVVLSRCPFFSTECLASGSPFLVFWVRVPTLWFAICCWLRKVSSWSTPVRRDLLYVWSILLCRRRLTASE